MLLFLGFLLILAGVSRSAGSRPVVFQPRLAFKSIEYLTNVSNFFITDLNGDGQPEFLRLFDDQRTFMANPLSKTSLFGPALYQGNSIQRIESITPIDIDTLPGTELAVVKRDPVGDSLWVEILCGYDKEKVLCRSQAVIGKNISDKGSHTPPGWDGTVYSCFTADLDNDGAKELIVPVVVGFDLYPRGLYVYSYPSGKLRWKFLMAGNPCPPRFADADVDGFQEIFIKTWATSNGAVVEDRTDSKAYLFCLDYTGKVLWRQDVGDRFDFPTGNALVCDCDKDGVTEIYYTNILQNEDYDRQVRLLEKRRARDNKFLKHRSFDADQTYYDIYAADLDGDSLDELIIDDFVGILRAEDLSMTRAGNFSKASVQGIVDVDGDKKHTPEIILMARDSIDIVDSELNIIGSVRADPGCIFVGVEHFVRPDGVHCLAARQTSGSGDRPSTVRIYEVGKAPVSKPVMPPGPIWPYAIMYGLGGFATGVLVGVTVKRARQRFRRELHTAQYDNLLTSLADFDHGRMAGKNLDRLLFLFSNLPDSSEKLEKIKPNMQAAVDAYQAFTSSQLDNIVEYGRRLKPIQSVTEQLYGHKKQLGELLTKNPAADLVFTETDMVSSSISAAITKIKTDIRQIRKAVQGYFSADLLRVIPSVLIATVAQLRQQRVGFRSITTRGGPLRLAFFSEAALASIFEELLTNACDAMENSETKELSMSIDFGADEVTIRLSDTGQGLQDADPEQLFRRGFSTKGKRGGFGLYHARQQVERFGGRIRLYDNEGGPGTTVELVLRVTNHD